MEKQQTALRLLISKLEVENKTANHHAMRVASAWALEIVKGYLTIERAHIIHAYDAGINNLTGDIDGEEYYDNRFKK